MWISHVLIYSFFILTHWLVLVNTNHISQATFEIDSTYYLKWNQLCFKTNGLLPNVEIGGYSSHILPHKYQQSSGSHPQWLCAVNRDSDKFDFPGFRHIPDELYAMTACRLAMWILISSVYMLYRHFDWIKCPGRGMKEDIYHFNSIGKNYDYVYGIS